jgi:hypothetical protein
VSVPELELDRPVLRVINGPGAPFDVSLQSDPSIQIAGWNPVPAVITAVAA